MSGSSRRFVNGVAVGALVLVVWAAYGGVVQLGLTFDDQDSVRDARLAHSGLKRLAHPAIFAPWVSRFVRWLPVKMRRAELWRDVRWAAPATRPQSCGDLCAASAICADIYRRDYDDVMQE